MGQPYYQTRETRNDFMRDGGGRVQSTAWYVSKIVKGEKGGFSRDKQGRGQDAGEFGRAGFTVHRERNLTRVCEQGDVLPKRLNTLLLSRQT